MTYYVVSLADHKTADQGAVHVLLALKEYIALMNIWKLIRGKFPVENTTCFMVLDGKPFTTSGLSEGKHWPVPVCWKSTGPYLPPTINERKPTVVEDKLFYEGMTEARSPNHLVVLVKVHF